jgi:hypothetical protein
MNSRALKVVVDVATTMHRFFFFLHNDLGFYYKKGERASLRNSIASLTA